MKEREGIWYENKIPPSNLKTFFYLRKENILWRYAATSQERNEKKQKKKHTNRNGSASEVPVSFSLFKKWKTKSSIDRLDRFKLLSPVSMGMNMYYKRTAAPSERRKRGSIQFPVDFERNPFQWGWADPALHSHPPLAWYFRHDKQKPRWSLASTNVTHVKPHSQAPRFFFNRLVDIQQSLP